MSSHVRAVTLPLDLSAPSGSLAAGAGLSSDLNYAHKAQG